MSFKRGKVIIISSAHFFHDIFSSILSVILPLLIQKLGITLTEASFLDISRKIPSLFNPFFGLLVQRKDVRYLVILTPAITAVSMGLLGITNSYIIALILLFVAGISATLFHIPSPTIIKSFSGNDVGQGMSYFMVGGELARTIGPLLAIYAISLWGLPGILALSLLGVMASIFLYFKLRNLPTHITAKKISKGGNYIIFKQLLPFFSSLGAYLLLNNSSKYAISLYLPVFLTQHGFSIKIAGIALAFLQFFGILGTFFSGKLASKIGRKQMLIISSIIVAISMALFLLVFKNSMILLFIVLIPLGFFLFTSTPIVLASVQDIKTSKPMFVNSLYMAINFGVGLIMIYLVGFFGEHIGLLETFGACAILTFMSVTFLFSSKFRHSLSA